MGNVNNANIAYLILRFDVKGYDVRGVIQFKYLYINIDAPSKLLILFLFLLHPAVAWKLMLSIAPSVVSCFSCFVF